MVINTASPKPYNFVDNIVPIEQQLEIVAEVPQDVQLESVNSNLILPRTCSSVNKLPKRNLRPSGQEIFLAGVLMWDEIMIKPGLEFNIKLDILEGFEDLGLEFDDIPLDEKGQHEKKNL
uniref:Uncharacterized protein n=1 Tax=Trichogramma kaykai TaxID=54128 RepID=A0ABD2WI46_9HYME